MGAPNINTPFSQQCLRLVDHVTETVFEEMKEAIRRCRKKQGVLDIPALSLSQDQCPICECVFACVRQTHMIHKFVCVCVFLRWSQSEVQANGGGLR